jgi:protein dpy-30
LRLLPTEPAAEVAAPPAAAEEAPTTSDAAAADAGAARHQLPVRQYLDTTVVPVMRKALRALVKTRPADPFDFLADFIRDNKP